MAKASKSAAAKKQAAASETHESIAEQVEQFLAAGNKIQKIPSGTSGMTSLSNRHITISSKRSAAN